MGKKKSVVFMTLLTIVIVALCALVAFPAFPIPGTPDSWNPVALQYDLNAELGGGYYVYYYPEGVIPKSEYDEQHADLTATIGDENVKADLKEKAEKKLKELEESYVAYANSLYLSTDPELAIVDKDGVPTDEFRNNFNSTVQTIAKRFAQKEYSSMRYAVMDDFALRVEIPVSELNVNGVVSAMILTGEMSLSVGDVIVEELEEEGVEVTDLIKSISIGTRYKTSYLKIRFTSAGAEMIERLKSTLSLSSSGTSGSTLDIKVGDEVIAQIYQDSIMSTNREARVFAVSQVDKAYLETFQIMMNNVLSEGEQAISFRALSSSDICQFAPVYGENVLTLLYIALAIVLLALIVLPIVFHGRYGAVGVYSTLSYFIVTTLCFAFITGGVLEVTLGTVFVFLAGLALVNMFHLHVYNAIKKEFELGKTIESSVKLGFKKTLWDIIDVYAVLLLGALALLIGAGNVYTIALQAIICIITGAFCNLLWARAINFTFLSASKNKYEYFRFVREDDEDDE